MKKILLFMAFVCGLPAAASSSEGAVHCPGGDKLVRMEDRSSFDSDKDYLIYRMGVIAGACGQDCDVRIDHWQLPDDFFEVGDLPPIV